MSDDIFPTLEVDNADEEYIQLKLVDYQAMCNAITANQDIIASYEALITKLQEVINAQNASIEEIRQLVQQTHIPSSEKPKIEKLFSQDFKI